MARQPHGGLLSKTSESYVHLFVWCLLMLLGVISDVEASAVAAGRRKRLLLSSYKAKPNPNVFPQPDRRATLNIECFDHERDESGSRWIAERDSLSRPSCLGLLLVGLAANRFVVKAIVTLYIAKTIHKLRTSDPVRRSLYFWRHAGPIVAHYKFTRWWMTASGADRQKRDLVFDSLHNRYAQPALDIVFHLRGLYVKMGQILSSRPDFMPTQYVQCFTELQDNIPPWETDVVQSIAVAALNNECPAFADYESLVLDPVALGSASIGQVHRAVLRRKNNNKILQLKEVAVKIMHEGARDRFQADFQVFRWLCRVAIPSWRGLLDALEQQVMTEFDYRNEAQSLKEVRNNMLNSPFRQRVCVPEPIEELCCEHVLVMEMLHGKKLIDSIRDRLTVAFGGSEEKASEFLSKRRHEVMTGEYVGSEEIIRSCVGKLKLLFLFEKCRRVIDLLVDVHGYQIFRTGTWNGDPHFGNCLQLDDGRLGLIDYGQTRRIDDKQRMDFAKIVVALKESRTHKQVEGFSHDANHFNTAAVAGAMRSAGFVTRNNTDDEIMTQYARIIFDSDEESERQGYSIPQEYFKSLMDLNPVVSIPDSAVFVGRTSLMFRGMGSAIGSGQIGTGLRWHKHASRALKEYAQRT